MTTEHTTRPQLIITMTTPGVFCLRLDTTGAYFDAEDVITGNLPAVCELIGYAIRDSALTPSDVSVLLPPELQEPNAAAFGAMVRENIKRGYARAVAG